MNTIIRGGVAVFLLCASVAKAAESTIQVAASRELRLAIVDNVKSSAAREAVHSAFAAGLSAAVSKACGTAVGVRAKSTTADAAAFSLGNGAFDAVLVLTGSLPRAMMTSDVTRLNATLGAGRSEKKAYLIFNNGDASLAQLLSASFAVAVTDGKFLDALDGNVAPLAVGSGAKIAATP